MTTPLYIETPLLESRALSEIAGAPVFLKMDALQPTGSFKARGMGTACQAAYNSGARQVVCASGGNAGYAVAYAGKQLGMRVTIVVPRTASPRTRDLIKQAGAELIEHGESWDDSNVFATQLARDTHSAYVHPFDDPNIWRGHATMIHEIARTEIKPGMMVVSVGGGGLLIGLLQGLHDVGWGDVPVLAVETEGAASFAKSVQAGRLVTLEKIATIATTLGARTVAAETLAWTKRHAVIPHLVTDRAAVNACLRFADDHRLLVEPACGASLAAVYDRAPALAGHAPIVVIVCGGVGVTRAMLDEWDRKILE